MPKTSHLLAVLACGLLFTSSARAGTEATKIVFKPTAAEVEYWIRNQNSVCQGSTTTPPEWHRYDTLELVSQRATQLTTCLDVNVVSHQKEMWADGQKLEARFPTDVFHYLLTAQGKITSETSADDPAAAMAPVFPDEPIAPGHKWSVIIPASQKFTVPIPITHTFQKVETVQGTACAVIITEGEASGKAPDGAFGFKLKVTGKTAIALKEGQLIRSSTITILNAKGSKSGPAGFPVLRDQTHRIVQRKTKEYAEAPEAPAGPK